MNSVALLRSLPSRPAGDSSVPCAQENEWCVCQGYVKFGNDTIWTYPSKYVALGVSRQGALIPLRASPSLGGVLSAQ